MNVLGIETSCDETAAAIVTGEGRVLSNIVATQIPVHARYGGVVPELASRNHLLAALPVVESALAEAQMERGDLDAIAVTQGPGLIGSLLVGIQTAKSIAWAFDLPLIGVDHVEAHITAAQLSAPPSDPDHVPVEPPYVALVASGGHTTLYHVRKIGEYEILGHTLDDAAGEAFDKIAKMSGLPYPGGVAIQNVAARGGDPEAHRFPRALMKAGNLDFSFSGLKTAVRNHLETLDETPVDQELADLAASAQEAIVDALVEKAIRGLRRSGCRVLVLGGGVAANHRLREKTLTACRGEDARAVLTPFAYCTDNAAMVAGLGARLLREDPTLGAEHGLDLDAYANLRVGSPRSHRRPQEAS
jgi:N6-L-threonylcarbamoyladenine synthase